MAKTGTFTVTSCSDLGKIAFVCMQGHLRDDTNTSAGTSDKILKCTQSCFLLSCFLSLSFSLLDAEVGGKNVDACGSFSPPVGLNV